MIGYVCTDCHYTYFEEEGDPEFGIKAGTAFKDLPDDWSCPVCGLPKEEFREFNDTKR